MGIWAPVVFKKTGPATAQPFRQPPGSDLLFENVAGLVGFHTHPVFFCPALKHIVRPESCVIDTVGMKHVDPHSIGT